MKSFILHPSSNGEFDPPVYALLRQIEGRTDDQSEADVLLVPVTHHPHFTFDGTLADKISKPWVMVDFTETSWDWNQEETHFYGKNTEKFFGDGYNEHWQRFDEFVRNKPPVLTFKRELLEQDRSDRVLPIEYLNYLPDEHGMDTRDEFRARPLEVMSSWGRSHEARMLLHGAIFTEAGRLGYDVISEYAHILPTIKDAPKSLKWATVHAPHFARIDVAEVQKFNRMARVVIALFGCGVKTFRHGEAASDALMAMPANRLAWSYPWTRENSIVLQPITDARSARDACTEIRDTLMRTDLYELYGRAYENSLNYRPDAYLRRWVVGNIERCL